MALSKITNSGIDNITVDGSGNVLVGTTGTDPNNATTSGGAGTAIRSDGRVLTGVYQDFAVDFNRINNNGEIIRLSKDGTTVGSIGTNGNLYIQGPSGTSGVEFANNAVRPWKDGARVDATVDLGVSGGRFDDIYAANGTIQTSDANEKQQIASLTDAEITAAKAISQLFKTFKWNDSVAEKGDAARTHTGVIAQDVQQAMTDAGLDAGNYAFFISTTWWETQTDVPAVEADEENDIEAQEAYTRIDTYDTAEEAPEGATERTRLGVRYPELLAFIGAATEQRLANIETRLAALENA
jgi:hypothetical protein